MAKNNEEMELLESRKISAEEADYTELPGAKKDAGCREVEVEGGVSSQLGCCNSFKWRKGAALLFSCGTCKYVTSKRDKTSAKG